MKSKASASCAGSDSRPRCRPGASDGSARRTENLFLGFVRPAPRRLFAPNSTITLRRGWKAGALEVEVVLAASSSGAGCGRDATSPVSPPGRRAHPDPVRHPCTTVRSRRSSRDDAGFERDHECALEGAEPACARHLAVRRPTLDGDASRPAPKPTPSMETAVPGGPDAGSRVTVGSARAASGAATAVTASSAKQQTTRHPCSRGQDNRR